MADDVTVRVDGLPALRRQLRRMGEDTSDLKDANQAAAALVAREGAARAPRRSGRLAGTVRGNRAAGRATVAAGGARLPYAGPVHWGWPRHNIEANPFIAAAAQDTEPRWLPLYESSLQRVVDKVGGTY